MIKIYLLFIFSLLQGADNDQFLMIRIIEEKPVFTLGEFTTGNLLTALIEYKRTRSVLGKNNSLLIKVDSDAAKYVGIKLCVFGMSSQGEYGPYYTTAFNGFNGYIITDQDEKGITKKEIPKAFFDLKRSQGSNEKKVDKGE